MAKSVEALYTPLAMAKFCKEAGRDIHARAMVPTKDGKGREEKKFVMGKGLYGPEWRAAGLDPSRLKKLCKKGLMVRDKANLQNEEGKWQSFTVFYMTLQMIEDVLNGQKQQSEERTAPGAPEPANQPKRQLATHSPIIDPHTNRPVRKEGLGLHDGNSAPATTQLEPPVSEENIPGQKGSENGQAPQSDQPNATGRGPNLSLIPS